MSTPPDLPEMPKIYDELEAIRFTAEWSGLPHDLVERVLDAKSRYLQLVGIINLDDADEEALARERAVYSHLIPETQNFVDDRMLVYMAEVTKVPMKTVQLVDQGEAAYADFLGLTEWDSDEERDAHLGTPELQEEAIQDLDPEAPEEKAPMSEGHGDHWGCVTEEVGPFIRKHLAVMPGPESLLYNVPSPTPIWETVTARSIPQTPSLATWRMDGSSGSSEEVITAFPVAKDGITHAITLHGARIWEAGCEAIIEASTSFGASIAYFDTAFLHPWNEWAPEAEVKVQLAAFAYALDPAPDQIIQITKEETVRVMRSIQDKVAPEEVTDLSPIEVHTKGMACFMPLRKGNPDEYEFLPDDN